MRRFFAVSTILLFSSAGLSLAGCGLFPKPDSTPVNQYNIAARATGRNTATATCGLVVQVRDVAASSPWMGAEMLYTENKHQIETYAYNRWAAPPATMLGRALTKALASDNLYRGVLGSSDPGRPDLVLAVSLNRGPLQVFPAQSGGAKSAPSSSREVLSLSAALTATPSGKLIASKTFTGDEAAAPNPYGGVVAANAVTARLLGQMLDWLAQSNSGIEACATH